MTRRARLKRSPLLGFFALTFAWSWACRALSPAIRPQPRSLETLLLFAGRFGPSQAAVVVVASTRQVEGRRAWLSSCLQWRVVWKWWAFAPFLPLAEMLLPAGLHITLGGVIGTAPAPGHLLMTLVNLPLAVLLGGPLGDEFGWRGYARPVLQDRMEWRADSLGLGPVWGMWHLPLFYIDDTAQARRPFTLWLPGVVAMPLRSAGGHGPRLCLAVARS